MRKEQCQWSSPAGWTPKPPGALGSSAQLLLVFGDAATATGADCLESLGNLYPNAQLFGCSSAGEIQGTTLSDGTLVTTAIAFDHTRVAAGRAPVQGCAGGFEAGVQAVSSLPKEGLRHVLVLAPGNYLNGGDLVRGINSVLPACVTASGDLRALAAACMAARFGAADDVFEHMCVVRVLPQRDTERPLAEHPRSYSTRQRDYAVVSVGRGNAAPRRE